MSGAALTRTRGAATRRVTYNGVSLQYTTLHMDCRVIPVARQDLMQEFLISITGYEPVGSRNVDYTSVPNNWSELRARLLTPHKELVISDLPPTAGATSVAAWLTVSPMDRSNRKLGTEDSLSVNGKYIDVQGGPYPVSFRLLSMFGSSFSYEFVIRVVVAGRDAVELFDKEAPVLGLEAQADYGIDENHYVTRRVFGSIFLARQLGNDIWKTDGFRGDRNAGPDSATLRRLLVGSTSGPALGFLQRSYSVPKGFRRTRQVWSFDPTLTRVIFEIVDTETYRTLPWGITSGDAEYGVKFDGTTWNAPLKTALSGVFEAPKDVPAEDLMLRILDLGKIMMSAGSSYGRYSTSFEYRRSLYRNVIEFQFGGLVNFGQLSMARASGSVVQNVLGAFGFGTELNQQIDKLGHSGTAYPPPMFGTGALKGDAYNARTATKAESVERNVVSSTGTGVPAYGFNNFFRNSDLPSEDVNERTVALSPGQIIFYHGENNLIVLARDFSNVGGQPTKAEITGGVQSMVFVGIKTDLVQVTTLNTQLRQTALYPATTVSSLSAYGTFIDIKTSSRETMMPSPLGFGFQNFDKISTRYGFWRLVLNADTQEAIQANNPNYGRLRSILSTRLANTTFSSLPNLISEMKRGLK